MAGAANLNAAAIYSQPWDGTGYGSASQNDTAQGTNLAATFDSFLLPAGGTLDSIDWFGVYLGQGPMTSFDISIWTDSGGQPLAVWNAFVTNGAAGDVLYATAGDGGRVYRYSAALPAALSLEANRYYWLSIVANLDSSSQWFWASGTNGDGTSAMAFLGQPMQQPDDMAFTLYDAAVPEPVGFLLVGGGLLAVTLARRRQRDITL
jgi:hypothetical protein